MTMFVLVSVVSLILLLWMIVKIWRDSMLLAIVAIFFWPALIIALIQNWGNEQTDIKVPFFLFVAVVGYGAYDAARTKAQQESLLWALRLFA